jgi:cytoskeletal protein CcmA (bactofilin family)
MVKLGKESKTTSFLSESCELKGNLHTKGGIRIDGKISGTLHCESVIYIGETGKIEAEISTKSMVSGGTIIGNITAEDTVRINAPGSVKGDIRTCNLGIEKNVFFDGRCQLLSPKDNKKPELRKPKSPRKAIPNRD